MPKLWKIEAKKGPGQLLGVDVKSVHLQARGVLGAERNRAKFLKMRAGKAWEKMESICDMSRR